MRIKKKIVLLLVMATTCFEVVDAQSTLGYQSAFGIAYGAKYMKLNDGDFYSFASIELNAFSYQTKFEYSAVFEYGKNYLSFEPFSIVGVLGMLMFNGQDNNLMLAAGILGTSGAKIPIQLFNGRVELTPRWNLLKLTKLYDNKLYLNGAAGVEMKIYLSDGLYISPEWEYCFGYKHISSAMKDYSFHNENANHSKSPFRGHNFGLFIGYYF